MTRAQLMNTALPTIEGLYAAYAKLFPEHAPQPISFCVIGPTRDELAALAPTVLRFLDEPFRDDAPRGLHLPVQAGDSLRSVAETFSTWFGDYQIPWGLCILLPEGVVADWPDGQRAFTSEMLHCLHPTLLLADLLQNAGPATIVALPDSALLDSGGRIQRSLLAQSIFRRRALDDLLSKGLPAEKPKGKTPPQTEASARNPQLHKVWTERGYGSGLCPRFVWAHETSDIEEIVSVASLSCREDEYIYGDPSAPSVPLSSHLRKLSPAMVRDLHANPSAVEHLARVALGEVDRGDDDRFVPIWELGPSGQWGVGGEIDRDLSGFRGMAATRGHELKRIDSLARIEACDDWSPGESRPNTLWFVAQGADVLALLRTAPAPPKKAKHESDQEHEANLAQWNAARQQFRLLTLNDCVDADYLWLAMADKVLYENLRCRGAKSYWSPVVPLSVLAETLVPWPPAAERKRTVDAFRKSVELVEKSDMGFLIQDLSSSWEAEEERFAPHNRSPISAREMLTEWDWFISRARDLVASLEQTAVYRARHPADSNKAGALPLPSYPPAPIAIARRLLANETVGSRRIRSMLELAQITMELDAAVMLSVLQQIDPLSAQGVWAKALQKRGDVLMSLGHKKMLAQETRRALLRHAKQPTADPALAQLAAYACDIDAKTWNTLADDIVSFRNNNLGHGFQLPPAAERSLADGFVPKVEEFVGLVSYLSRNMLVYLESRSTTKTGTECVFRMLVHDNSIFPRNHISRPKGSALDTLDEREVYVSYAERDGMLSLWPWVLFAPPGTTQDAI